MSRARRLSSPSSRSLPLSLRPGMAWALRAACAVTVLSLVPMTSPRAQGTLSALQTDVDAIARRARPSVVTVFAVRTEDGTKSASSTSPPTPRVRTRAGSGVAVASDLVLTTASVVLDAERTLISTAGGHRVEVQIVGVDPVFNLALLRVPTLRLPPLRFALGRPARVGDWV